MRLWQAYLRKRRGDLVGAAAFLGLFAAVMWLYRLPWEPFFYAALLGAFSALAYFGLGFLRCARHVYRADGLRDPTAQPAGR